MSKESIVERILSDADAECEAILSAANARAEEIVASATARARADRAETEAELDTLTRKILEVNAATARLDSAKVLLAEKRRVIETVYARALERLNSLKEKESLAFLERLLRANAEEGDEIVFDETFRYQEGAAKLPIVKQLKLKIGKDSVKLGGGCILRGKRCDKDLSYPALLDADAEAHQSEIAKKLFANS